MIREPENVTVGESTKTPCSSSVLFQSGFRFVAKGNNYFLQFTDTMAGKVSLRGAIRSLMTSVQVVMLFDEEELGFFPSRSPVRQVVIDGISVLFQLCLPSSACW